MITKTKNQIQKMGNDIEGMLNDFEGGITEKEETIVNIIDYIVQRAEATLNNFKRDLMISIENRRKFYLENNRPDNASTLEILYNDIKNDQLLDFMKKDGFPVEAEVSEKIAKMAILMLHNWMHAQIRIFEKQKQAKEQESNRENWNAGYVACCEDIVANLKGFLKDNFGEDNITENETIIKSFVSNFSR